MKKISLKSVSDFLSDNQLKRVTGGYGVDYVCLHHCMMYDGVTSTGYIWGTCYDAYHYCNSIGATANCNCNG